jgi:hypothetical protein
MTKDTLAVAVDWLDAYRGKSLDITEMYEQGATISCGCSGLSIGGASAIESYWTERFRAQPALELVDIVPTDGSAVFISYRTSVATVKAVLGFGTGSGKIAWQRCGPDAIIRALAGGVR